MLASRGVRPGELCVTRNPSDRIPDPQMLLTSSGFGIVQNSAAPVGMTPSRYATEGIEGGMTCVIVTMEWAFDVNQVVLASLDDTTTCFLAESTSTAWTGEVTCIDENGQLIIELR